MANAAPSMGFDPFELGFRYDPYSLMVQGIERRNQLSAAGRSPWWQALQAELGTPPALDLCLFQQWWPLARTDKQGNLKGPWKGFYFEVVGPFAGANDLRPGVPLFWLHSASAAREGGYTARDPHPYAGMDATPILAWRRRVVYRQSPPWLEARWHPDTGVHIALRGLEHGVRLEQIRWVPRGLQLLQQLEQRGRRPGPTGFQDGQEFEDTLVLLIQEAHAKGVDPTQGRIATLVQPVLARRRGETGSPSSVDIDVKSTERLIRKHLSCRWRALVKKALQSP
jgi:hypothetical protein